MPIFKIIVQETVTYVREREVEIEADCLKYALQDAEDDAHYCDYDEWYDVGEPISKITVFEMEDD